jgi:transglutaminase-like putative cysteine protease
MLHSGLRRLFRGRSRVRSVATRDTIVKPGQWRIACVAVLLAVCSCMAVAQSATEPADVPSIVSLIDTGHFSEARHRIDDALAAPGLSAGERQALEFQRERMHRILLDFTLDADAVKARVRKQIPDLTDAQFAKWDADGLFEHMVIDGRTLYFNRSPSNLFRLSPEALARRADHAPLVDGPMETANSHHRAIIDAALAQHRSNVLPRRVRVTQSLTVNADAVPAGETVRAWIPYPRALPGQQERIRYVSSIPDTHVIAPESTLQRTVYLEKPAQAGQPMQFSVTYELTLYAQYHAIDPDTVVAATITPDLAPWVSERGPHVVFTDDMRAFSRKVVGDETNPYRIARKLFAAVDRIPWAGAREYSTITNISDYALHAGHADCGQQTLLLMTLLRLNGIPARWQSGMVFSDGEYNNLHDWGWLYLAPYGWVPMDVTFGRLDSDDPAVANFYLGGLDAWRIAFNDDYGRDLVPAKQHFRSETVDLQRGETEWSGGNLYFDKWDYDFKAEVLPAQDGHQ